MYANQPEIERKRQRQKMLQQLMMQSMGQGVPSSGQNVLLDALAKGILAYAQSKAGEGAQQAEEMGIEERQKALTGPLSAYESTGVYAPGVDKEQELIKGWMGARDPYAQQLGTELFVDRLKEKPALTPMIRNMMAAGISPESPEGRQMILDRYKPAQTTIAPVFTDLLGKSVPISKTTKAATEKEQINVMRQLQRMKGIAEQYNSDYLTYGGKLKAFAGRTASKIKPGMIPEYEKFAGERRKLTQGVERFFNEYRKEITGAAAQLAELEKLKESTINVDLPPAEFPAAYNDLVTQMVQLYKFNQKILSEGGLPADEISERMDSGEWKAMDVTDEIQELLIPEMKDPAKQTTGELRAEYERLRKIREYSGINPSIPRRY